MHGVKLLKFMKFSAKILGQKGRWEASVFSSEGGIHLLLVVFFFFLKLHSHCDW